jgi:hypothetical protein
MNPVEKKRKRQLHIIDKQKICDLAKKIKKISWQDMQGAQTQFKSSH